MDSKDKYFDIIGFDPRGVNNTTPTASCFPDDASRQNWQIQIQAQGLLTTNDSFPTVLAREQALARSCSAVLTSNDSHVEEVGKYMNTPVVVTDMVEIAERLGEWREKQATKELINTSEKLRQTVMKQVAWKKGNETILYWGFSYGTLLGATLAAMHPKRIRRVVLDGVCDADDYYAGGWLSNLQDTDLILDQFFTQCYEAGPDNCALHVPSHTYGPFGIKEKFDSVLQSLRLSPLPVDAHGPYSADIITYSDLLNELTQVVYKPHALFHRFARIVHEMSKGNGTELAALKQSGRKAFCPTSECRRDGPWSDSCHDPRAYGFSGETSGAIHCTDAPDYSKKNAHFFWDRWHKLLAQSKYLAGTWTEITAFCGSYTTRPSWEFDGRQEHPQSPPFFSQGTN